MARPADGIGRRVRCSSARRMRHSCSCGKAAASEFLPNLAALTICPAFGGIFFHPIFFQVGVHLAHPAAALPGVLSEAAQPGECAAAAAAVMQPPSGILCTPVTPGKSYRIFLTVFFVAAVKKKKAFVSQNIKVSWTAHGCYAGPLWCAAWLHDRLPESSPQLAEHLESWWGSPEQSGCGAGGQSDERREISAPPRTWSRRAGGPAARRGAAGR